VVKRNVEDSSINPLLWQTVAVDSFTWWDSACATMVIEMCLIN